MKAAISTSKIKCIGFDLYSTLINTDNHDWNAMLNEAFNVVQKIGFQGTLDQFKKIWSEIYWKWRAYRENNHVELKSNVWWREILETIGLQFTELDINRIILASHQKWRTQISIYPKVKELLLELKKNYMLVCISNISEGDLAKEDMDLFDILKIFDYVVMSSDLGIRKPSPKIFEHVLNHLKIRNDEMIFIGDTLYDDVQGAKAANLLMAIHVKRDRSYFHQDYYIEPDHTIENLHQIREILNKKR